MLPSPMGKTYKVWEELRPLNVFVQASTPRFDGGWMILVTFLLQLRVLTTHNVLFYELLETFYDQGDRLLAVILYYF